MASGSRLLAVERASQVFVLTDAGRPVLAGEQQVLLRKDPVRQARGRSRSSGPAVELPAVAAPVLERLRAWRGATAKEQGVPAYVVFHDATLREIVTQALATLAALGTISGIGEAKLARSGDEVLAALAGS